MSYSLIRKLLFQCDPERAHDLSLKALSFTHRLGLNRFLFPTLPSKPVQVMGLNFPNPIGLAAGLDKNGDYIDALASIGFGFIEIGTVTPCAQPGNPKPRLFRLVDDEAIINRMGFNNEGLEHLLCNLKRSKYQGILGINIGKNKDTPLSSALLDYQLGFRAVAPYASYITVNISSPNTPELRDLQHGQLLDELLGLIKEEQVSFLKNQGRSLPVAVKIAPDLSEHELGELATALLQHKVDAVIATNTTVSREALAQSRFAQESGGLSGKPLMMASTRVVNYLSSAFAGQIPIIAVGGVFSTQDVYEKLVAGASLVQVYTGFIYQGPWWIRELIKTFRNPS